MTIYLPNTNYSCYYLQSEGTIRAYHSMPRVNSQIDYTDYYINSHYLKRNGTQTFGNNSSSLPICMTDTFTTDVYYRNDLDQILTITIILLLICFYFPYRIISRMFGRWFKW